jgi:hypothetical protein
MRKHLETSPGSLLLRLLYRDGDGVYSPNLMPQTSGEGGMRRQGMGPGRGQVTWSSMEVLCMGYA